MKADNTEESFKCSECGYTFSRGTEKEKNCPKCGYACTVTTCGSLGVSNEGY